MRYYVVTDSGEVMLETVWEAFALTAKGALGGQITASPDAGQVDAWDRDASGHFFHVLVPELTSIEEPYVAVELAWPVLSFWRQDVAPSTMTRQALHARYEDAAAAWFAGEDVLAERHDELSNADERPGTDADRPKEPLGWDEGREAEQVERAWFERYRA